MQQPSSSAGRGPQNSEAGSSPARTITTAIGEFLLLALLTLLAPAAIGIDIFLLGNSLDDASVTEFTQEGLLLASALVFWLHAWKIPAARGFLVLVAGFFSCMLIREFDYLFDLIWHGFWQWPAAAIAAVSIGYARLRCRGTVLQPMADFIGSRPYIHLVTGLVIVIVFSRVFGSGNLFWEPIIADYQHLYKSVIQEGTELLGYVFVAWGSLQTLRQGITGRTR